jgi:hypothetical protein
MRAAAASRKDIHHHRKGDQKHNSQEATAENT